MISKYHNYKHCNKYVDNFGTFDSGLLVLVLSWTDASLVTNVLQMMQRRYDANAKPGTNWRNPRSPVRIKKRRNFYEDNKYKKKPEYKRNKSPAPARQKRIDLGMDLLYVLSYDVTSS